MSEYMSMPEDMPDLSDEVSYRMACKMSEYIADRMPEYMSDRMPNKKFPER